MKRFIFYTYAFLFALIPLVFYWKTSELFEFNKIILLYLSTTTIASLWIAEMIQKQKFVFRRTVLDYPLLFFLGTQALSTLISIDTRTSFLGYYSRWNGGLLSLVSFAILFWAYVTFINKKESLILVKVLIASTVLAAIYAGLEHFGYSFSCQMITGNFDVSCWVQDVQNRVFGTFGQPNWLAAWLIGIIPLTWALSLGKKISLLERIAYITSFALILIVIYYTKSRSGILGFAVSSVTFFIIFIFINRKNIVKNLTNYFVYFGVLFVYILAITLLINTPWKPNLINQTTQNTNSTEQTTPEGPALEVGGTDSGKIRKIVWKGALDLTAKYPLFGSGVETFAFSYYQTRPVEHNMVSEWNFLYNKAHNEYLNYLATTGVFGFVAYLGLLAFAIYTFYPFNNLRISLLSGYVAILVSNFFGFTVVATNLLLFIYPAISLSLDHEYKDEKTKPNQNQIYLLVVLAFATLFIIFNIWKYWQADYLYARGIDHSRVAQLDTAKNYLEEAVSYYPNEPIYRVELAETLTNLSLNYAASEDMQRANNYALAAVENLKIAEELSPYNVKQLKRASDVYGNLGRAFSDMLIEEYKVLSELVKIAPTDASINYRYTVSLARVGKPDEAVKQLIYTIELKPDYKLARKLLGYMYEDLGQPEKSKEQYEYILANIDPNDEEIKEDLERVSSNLD